MICKECLHYPVCHSLALSGQADLIPPQDCEFYTYYLDWLYCPGGNPDTAEKVSKIAQNERK